MHQKSWKGLGLDLDSLKFFLHLSESLHFGKTGRACNLSPSALSRQIQRLEEEVGRKLFERDNRRVALTPEGLAVKVFAREALEKWRNLLDTLADVPGGLKGEIILYGSVTASLSILPGLLSAFKAAHPEVKIRLQTGDAGLAIKKVLEGEADIAVAALPESLPPGLAFKVLARISLDFIAPAQPWEYSGRVEKDPPWDEIPMVLSERGLARQRIDAWFKQKNIVPNIYAQVSGNEAILSMVSLGCGVGVVPSLALENSSLQTRVTRLEFSPALKPYDVGICVQKRRMGSRLIQAFWDMEG